MSREIEKFYNDWPEEQYGNIGRWIDPPPGRQCPMCKADMFLLPNGVTYSCSECKYMEQIQNKHIPLKLKKRMGDKFWIGVDFDGTLVKHEFPKIGAPVELMLDRVRRWIASGKCVKIMTARVARDSEFGTVAEQMKIIHEWCDSMGLPRLEITATKDYLMTELWDDRAVQIERNTGRIVADLIYHEGYNDGQQDEKERNGLYRDGGI